MKKNILLTGLSLLGFMFSADVLSYHNVSLSALLLTKQGPLITSEKVVDTVITDTFRVYGNCGMCERTIEGALENVHGVQGADWNNESGQMTVTYDTARITLGEIKQKIADVGYDSDTHRAEDETYNGLPGCCQYERPENK